LPYSAKEHFRGKKSLSVQKGIKSVNGILLGRDFMQEEMKVETTADTLYPTNAEKYSDSSQVDRIATRTRNTLLYPARTIRIVSIK